MKAYVSEDYSTDRKISATGKASLQKFSVDSIVSSRLKFISPFSSVYEWAEGQPDESSVMVLQFPTHF